MDRPPSAMEETMDGDERGLEPYPALASPPPNKAPALRYCLWCGKDISTKRPHARWCSSLCRHRGRYAVHKELMRSDADYRAQFSAQSNARLRRLRDKKKALAAARERDRALVAVELPRQPWRSRAAAWLKGWLR